jgi:hypothetical protein
MKLISFLFHNTALLLPNVNQYVNHKRKNCANAAESALFERGCGPAKTTNKSLNSLKINVFVSLRKIAHLFAHWKFEKIC